MSELRAPFPYFGGKRTVVEDVWRRFGEPKQYVEPFCGSAAMLLAAPQVAPLEVVGDQNCYIANFWRAVKYQPDTVAGFADYPVSHIDLHARHAWLTAPERVQVLVAALADPEWPGDAKVAGWWCWGQCAWIGSGWCDSCTNGRTDGRTNERSLTADSVHRPRGTRGATGKVPHCTNAGRGVQRPLERERERERDGRARTEAVSIDGGPGLATVFL